MSDGKPVAGQGRAQVLLLLREPQCFWGVWEQLKGYNSKKKCFSLTPPLRDSRAITHPLPGSGMRGREVFHSFPWKSHPEVCGVLPTPSKGE